MPNVASVLREEILRLACKELRSVLGPLKKTNTDLRHPDACAMRHPGFAWCCSHRRTGVESANNLEHLAPVDLAPDPGPARQAANSFGVWSLEDWWFWRGRPRSPRSTLATSFARRFSRCAGKLFRCETSRARIDVDVSKRVD